jgi:hypothetical protein
MWRVHALLPEDDLDPLSELIRKNPCQKLHHKCLIHLDLFRIRLGIDDYASVLPKCHSRRGQTFINVNSQFNRCLWG